jgi:hypothetical protein
LSSNATENGRMVLASARNSMVATVLHFVFYGALGIYLLRWGAWIHRLLRHVTPERSNTTPHTDARDAQASASDGGARPGGRER